MSKSADVCKPVSPYFKHPKTLDKVTNAEVIFTEILLEHNLPFEAASHARHLFQVMFPDSKIGKKYRCTATKEQLQICSRPSFIAEYQTCS